MKSELNQIDLQLNLMELNEEDWKEEERTFVAIEAGAEL